MIKNPTSITTMAQLSLKWLLEGLSRYATIEVVAP